MGCSSDPSDYERFFLPFTLQSHTVCAPYNRFLDRRVKSEKQNVKSMFLSTELEPGRLGGLAESKVDSPADNDFGGEGSDINMRNAGKGDKRFKRQEFILDLVRDDADDTSNPESSENSPANKTATSKRWRRGYREPCVRDVMLQLQKSPSSLAGFEDKKKETANPAQHPSAPSTLEAISIKYLHFAEDVRPPYFGSFTRLQSLAAARNLSRNPISRQLPETNYDYDSEAEWEEPEEGEDLQSNDDDDEEEEDGEGEDDIAAFLDDEGAEGAGLGGKRRAPLGGGDFEPLCSGLWWEDEKGRLVASIRDKVEKDRNHSSEVDFSAYRIGYLLGKLSKTSFLFEHLLHYQMIREDKEIRLDWMGLKRDVLY